MEFMIGSALAYLLGSLSSAIILCKFCGLPDPRTQGSKNAGATNILRTAGKKNAAYVLLADFSKGLLPLLIARFFHLSDLALGFIAVFAVLGHVFPVFFQFRGGKGVATMLGAIMGLSFGVGVLTIITWIAVAFIFRYSSLASMVSAVASIALMIMAGHPAYAFPLFLVTIIIFVKHWKNIERLRFGTESKLKF